jgi:hypothetical protein
VSVSDARSGKPRLFQRVVTNLSLAEMSSKMGPGEAVPTSLSRQWHRLLLCVLCTNYIKWTHKGVTLSARLYACMFHLRNATTDFVENWCWCGGVGSSLVRCSNLSSHQAGHHVSSTVDNNTSLNNTRVYPKFPDWICNEINNNNNNNNNNVKHSSRNSTKGYGGKTH